VRGEQAGGIRHQPRLDPLRQPLVEPAGMTEVWPGRRQVGDVELAAADPVEKADQPRGFVERRIAFRRMDAFGKCAAVERRARPPDFLARLLRRGSEAFRRQLFEALLDFAAFVRSEIAQLDFHRTTTSNSETRPCFSPTATRLPSGDQRMALISPS